MFHSFLCLHIDSITVFVRFVQFVFNFKSVRFAQSVFKSYQGDFYKFVLFVIMPV